MTRLIGDTVAVTLMVSAALVGDVLIQDLPPRMAIHFGPSGTPDQTVPTPLGFVLTPAIGLTALGILRSSFRVDTPTNPLVRSLVTAWLGLVIAGIQALLLA